MAVDLLWLAVVFLVIAIIAYALGARELAGFTAGIGRFVFWVFLVLFVVTVLIRLLT